MENNNKKFSFESFFYKILIIVFAVFAVYFVVRSYQAYDDKKDFIVASKKPDNSTSDKAKAIEEAHRTLRSIYQNNRALNVTNLNISKMYGNVEDKDTTSFYSAYVAIPVLSDEVMPIETTYEDNVAYQIYGKLKVRYELYRQRLYNMYNLKPEDVVKEYGFDQNAIIGKFNPDIKFNKNNLINSYKIQNFQNVNITTYDGDGNPLDSDNNIKDIMSMASVYTYYHDPYDYDEFLLYAYYLFDKSYTYEASISEVYYCSGCMHYDTENEAIAMLYEKPEVTQDKISPTLHVNNRLPKTATYKEGRLIHIDENAYSVPSGDYESYIESVKEGKTSSYYNYCPGHIDLDIKEQVLTIDASNSLFSADDIYGNNRKNYNMNWNGWNHMMIHDTRELYYKDWEKEYGLSFEKPVEVTPLTQEEINYFMNRIDKDLTLNRRKIIETALKSVGRIPYYYGGKSSVIGYDGANFGRKVLPDYRGRCLKGLDCSGWVNWVYNTTFKRSFLSVEGTQKLAGVGNKIRRENLKPGDIIVRPGHNSHVMMFLEWADDGKIIVIHENGTASNVSIGTYDAYYPYYRSILDV